MPTNAKFDFRGIHHLALVCKDMKKTVDFYGGVLGMPLTKTIDLPGGSGQHFFFDVGNGDMLAFFWFPDAPEAVPGVTHAGSALASAHASMNHVAFSVPDDKLDEYRSKLVDAGIHATEVVHHDDSDTQASPTPTDTTFVRSVYFRDPDGILLEFAAWTRELDERDVNVAPMSVEA